MHDQFKKELTDLIKLHSLNTHCKVPSNDLADYMVKCALEYKLAVEGAIELQETEEQCKSCEYHGKAKDWPFWCEGCLTENKFNNFKPLTPNPEPTVSGDEDGSMQEL